MQIEKCRIKEQPEQSSALMSSLAFRAEGRPQKNEKGKNDTQLHKEVERKPQTTGDELV